jgi:hypothetical protein
LSYHPAETASLSKRFGRSTRGQEAEREAEREAPHRDLHNYPTHAMPSSTHGMPKDLPRIAIANLSPSSLTLVMLGMCQKEETGRRMAEEQDQA